MDQKEYVESLKAMREEIVRILATKDLSKDKQAQKAIKTIDNMFKRAKKNAEDVMPKEILEQYYEGVKEAGEGLKNEGMDMDNVTPFNKDGGVAEAFKTHVHMDAIEEMTDDLMLDLQAAIRTARENTHKSIKDTLDKVKDELQKGEIRGSARRETQKRVAKAFQESGLTSFTTIDGKKLPLDFYSEVVTRTNIKRANTRGAINRYKERDQDLVQISEHSPTCEECEPFQGLVFSLSGDDDRFPYLEKEPPFHANCNHSARPYVEKFKEQNEIDSEQTKAKGFDPSKDTRTTSEKKAYNQQQKLHRQNRRDMKQYERYKAVLGNEASKSLGGFKRSKRANSKKFQEMKKKYREANKSMV